ncbi:hypothetical protein [Streptomyces sp. NPDC057249]|uniref:hypothetical protein n=1 Tax=Streptomyces sp. NPDC057249 TaxID=3346067 RepID=UPI003634B89F
MPESSAGAEDQMAAAVRAEEQGHFRKAANLFYKAGAQFQTQYGRFDSRALDAFEGAARAVRKSALAD